MQGDVGIRFSVKDEETVRAALERLGKDGESTLRRLNQSLAESGKQPGALADGFDRAGDAATGAARKILGMVTASLTIAGVIATIQSMKNALAALGDRSEDTRLRPETLQALALAAAEGRVPIEQLNAAIDKFTVASKQADGESNTFYKALRNVGSGFAEAFKAAGSQEERLRIVSNAYRSTADEVKRAQLATEAWGTDNERVARVLGSGEAAMQSYIARAQELGLTVDEAMIKRAQDAQSKMGTLALVLKDKLMVAVGELIPVARDLVPIVQRLANAVTDYFASFANIENLSSGQLKRGIQRFMDEIEGLQQDVARENRKKSQVTLVDSLLGNSPQDIDERILEIDVKIQQARRQIDRWREQLAVTEVREKAQGGTAPPAPPAFKPRPPLLDAKERDAFDRDLERVAREIALIDAEGKAIGKSAAARERLRVEASLWAAVERAGLEPTEELTQKIERLGERAEQAAGRLEQMKNKAPLLELARDAANLERNLNEGLAGTLRGVTAEFSLLNKSTDTAAQRMTNFALKLADAWLQALLLRNVVAPMASGLSSFTSFLFPTAPAGETSSISGSARGNVFEHGSIVPFRMGGVVRRPTLFRMGNGRLASMAEDSEEGILPLQRGPGGRLGVAAYGGGRGQTIVNVSVENRSGAQVDVQQRRGNDGTMEPHLVIRDATDAAIANGDHDAALQARFGLRPVRARR